MLPLPAVGGLSCLRRSRGACSRSGLFRRVTRRSSTSRLLRCLIQTPFGHYFNALYQTGFYYEFLGWGQMIAAILLLIPRTSHIGALLFLPIIANIAVLTASVGFKGTWVITILMTLAATYLVGWEYDRLKPIIFSSREDSPRKFRFQFLKIPAFFAFGGVLMGVVWWAIGLGNFASYLKITALLAAAGFVFGMIVSAHYRFMPVGHLTKTIPQDQMKV